MTIKRTHPYISSLCGRLFYLKKKIFKISIFAVGCPGCSVSTLADLVSSQWRGDGHRFRSGGPCGRS